MSREKRSRHGPNFAAMEGQKRVAWTAEEDKRLVKLVEKLGTHNWPDVATEMGGNRTSKSCSLRWRCFLNPNLKRPCDDPLSEWEIAVIVEAQKSYGNRWTLIASLLPGRCNNDIKNYFNLYLKSQVPGGDIKNKYLVSGLSLQDLLRDAPEDILEKEREAAEAATASRMPMGGGLRSGSGLLAQESLGHPGSTVQHMLYRGATTSEPVMMPTDLTMSGFADPFAGMMPPGMAPPPAQLAQGGGMAPRTGLQGLPVIKTGNSSGAGVSTSLPPGVVTTPGPPQGAAGPSVAWPAPAPGLSLGKRSFSMSSASEADYAALLEAVAFMPAGASGGPGGEPMIHHSRVQSAPMVLPPGQELFQFTAEEEALVGLTSPAGPETAGLSLKRHRSLPVHAGLEQLLGQGNEQLLSSCWDSSNGTNSSFSSQQTAQAAAQAPSMSGSVAHSHLTAAYARMQQQAQLQQVQRQMAMPGAQAQAGQPSQAPRLGLSARDEEAMLRQLLGSAMEESGLAQSLGLQQQRSMPAGGLTSALPPPGPSATLERRVSESSSGAGKHGAWAQAAAGGQQQAGFGRQDMFDQAAAWGMASQQLPGGGKVDETMRAALSGLGGEAERFAMPPAVVVSGSRSATGAAAMFAGAPQLGDRPASHSDSNTTSPVPAAADGGLAQQAGGAAAPQLPNAILLQAQQVLLSSQQKQQQQQCGADVAAVEGSPVLPGYSSSMRSTSSGHTARPAPTNSLHSSPQSMEKTGQHLGPTGGSMGGEQGGAPWQGSERDLLRLDHHVDELLAGIMGCAGKHDMIMSTEDTAAIQMLEQTLVAQPLTSAAPMSGGA